MTILINNAIILCKTHLGGEVLWHLHQEIVHQGAGQIQQKLHQRAQRRRHLEPEVEKRLLKQLEKMSILQSRMK